MPEGEQTCRQVVVAECDEEACESSAVSVACGPQQQREAGGLGEDTTRGGCGAEHFTEAQVLGGAWKEARCPRQVYLCP